MSKEVITRIEYGERMLEAYLEELEDQLPLRWREIHISGALPLPLPVQLRVCEHGNLHLIVGPHHSMGTILVDGLFAYTMALILDTRKACPKRPSLEVVQDRIGQVHHVISGLDLMVSASYVHNLHVLHGWLDTYVEEASGSPLFPRPEARQTERQPAKRPSARGRAKPPVKAPQEPAAPTNQLVSGPDPRDPYADVDTGTSQIVRHPLNGWARMFGILAMPMDVGDA